MIILFFILVLLGTGVVVYYINHSNFAMKNSKASDIIYLTSGWEIYSGTDATYQNGGFTLNTNNPTNNVIEPFITSKYYADFTISFKVSGNYRGNSRNWITIYIGNRTENIDKAFYKGQNLPNAKAVVYFDSEVSQYNLLFAAYGTEFIGRENTQANLNSNTKFVYLKITRKGTTLNMYYSYDNINYILVSTAEVIYDPLVIGLGNANIGGNATIKFSDINLIDQGGASSTNSSSSSTLLSSSSSSSNHSTQYSSSSVSNQSSRSSLSSSNSISSITNQSSTSTNSLSQNSVVCGALDVNNDGKITIIDFIAFAALYGSRCSDTPAPSNYSCGPKNSSGYGRINIADLIHIATEYGLSCK